MPSPHSPAPTPRYDSPGGCVDHETKGGEVIVSEFYNELYTFAFENQRWYTLGLRGAPAPKQAGGDGAAGSEAHAEVEEGVRLGL